MNGSAAKRKGKRRNGNTIRRARKFDILDAALAEQAEFNMALASNCAAIARITQSFAGFVARLTEHRESREILKALASEVGRYASRCSALAGEDPK